MSTRLGCRRGAREAYDDLTDDQKALVYNYDYLVEVEDLIEEFLEEPQYILATPMATEG